MKKFGLFGGNVRVPMQRYEGDQMVWDANREYVQIIAGDTTQGNTRTVAVIRLDKGQSVKELLRDGI